MAETLIERFSLSPKEFPDDLLEALAKEIRTRILEVVSKNGGHLASSLGTVELTIALLKVFNAEADRILWDVGHQTYAWKILTGRNDRFESLRSFGGISGFPRRDESPSDAFGAGHAGSAISAAVGMAAARDIRGTNENVVAVIGDASIANGISLEGLNNVNSGTKRLIVILNDNEMSISNNVGALARHLGTILASRRYNKLKTSIEDFAKKLRLHWLANCYHRWESRIKSLFVRNVVFEDLGLRYIGPLDGHNIQRLVKAFTIARDYNRPIVLHLATQKGKGYAPSEKNPSAWHGVSPFSIETGKPLSSSGEKTYSDVFGEVITSMASTDNRVVAITAAMKSGTGLDLFCKEHKDRFFDVGICEEHAVTFAGGLAANGMRPFVAIYSTFAQRAVDSFFHDVCLQNAPVTLCLDRSGAVGQDGSTHHGLYDIPLFKSLPSVVFMAPRDEESFRAIMNFSLASESPMVIRYPRGNCPKSIGRHGQIRTGRAEIVKEPSQETTLPVKLWIWALGDMVKTALDVADELQNARIASVGVVDPIFVKPVDAALIRKEIEDGALLATIENGVLDGGFGTAILEVAGSKLLARFGFGDKPPAHGKNEQLFKEAGLDPREIASVLMKKL